MEEKQSKKTIWLKFYDTGKLHEIVKQTKPNYDGSVGYDGLGYCYCFITNFKPKNLPVYEKLASMKMEGIEMAYAKEAYGFDEEEGLAFPCSDLYALFIRYQTESLSDFWKKYDEVAKEMNLFYC